MYDIWEYEDCLYDECVWMNFLQRGQVYIYFERGYVQFYKYGVVTGIYIHCIPIV